MNCRYFRTTHARKRDKSTVSLMSQSLLELKEQFWHLTCMNERISIDPRICHGQACVTGTRIPVHQIVRMLANGDSIEDLLLEYPSLTHEDIHASLEYAARLH